MNKIFVKSINAFILYFYYTCTLLFYFTIDSITAFSIIQRSCFTYKMYDKQQLLKILLHPDFCTVQNNGRPYPPSAEIYHTIA